MRLSRYFGTSESLWINLHADYDMEMVKDIHADELARIRPRRAG